MEETREEQGKNYAKLIAKRWNDDAMRAARLAMKTLIVFLVFAILDTPYSPLANAASVTIINRAGKGVTVTVYATDSQKDTFWYYWPTMTRTVRFINANPLIVGEGEYRDGWLRKHTIPSICVYGPDGTNVMREFCRQGTTDATIIIEDPAPSGGEARYVRESGYH